MHTSDKSGIIDSMSDDVSESKNPEADVVGEPGLALARSQAKLAEMAGQHGSSPQDGRRVVFGLEDVSVSYSGTVAIRDVAFDIHENLATAFIGPSGCGKTTLLRSMNRMNDLIQGAEVAGRITYHGQDLFGAGVDAVEVRRRIGMVFQRPNPFPKSIYDNVAFGLRIHGMKDDLSDRVENGAAPRGAVGRGQGPPKAERAVALRRAAAAPLHRAGSSDRAGRDPDGRAGLGARPGGDPRHRGAGRRAQGPTTRS